MISTVLGLVWLAAVGAAPDSSFRTVPPTDPPHATAADTASASQDSSGAPRPPIPRSVVVLQALHVRASRLHDPMSSATVHLIPLALARALPVDRAADLVALQSGVVATGEDLHVRGGRAGETRSFLQGIGLDEPLRGRPIELPLTSLREAELASGGLDADLGGALAGVVSYRTVEPGERWSGETRWSTDGRTGTHYDDVAARAGGPIGFGLGAVASAEARLDDTHLPRLHSVGRRSLLGGSFGWRAQNRLLGHLKLTTSPAATQRWTLEAVANRRVDLPFDPMWSLDGWMIPNYNVFIPESYLFSDTPVNGAERWIGADHLALTETRALAAMLGWSRQRGPNTYRAVAGWLTSRSITSLSGADDESYVVPERYPTWGLYDSPLSQPFYVYHGDEPYFLRKRGSRFTLRSDLQHQTSAGNVVRAGAGFTHERVSLHELDYTANGLSVDSLRRFVATAPGAFAYGQVRWGFEGLIANLGVRAEYFTSGPAARDQSIPSEPSAVWSLSPRFGVAYPISVNNVFSLSYVRMVQNPDREFLYDDRHQITNRQPLGQPSLIPSTVISYQAAVKHLFGPAWAMQAAVFYRDLFDLIGARDANDPRAMPQLRYENADDAQGSGFELSMLHDGDHRFAELHYTFLEARGTQSREEGVPFGPRTRTRPETIGQHPLAWDRRHSVTLLAHVERPHLGSVSWITFVGSGLPWTPRARRELDADLSNENAERFKWDESTALTVRWFPPWIGAHLRLGVDVRNAFDRRSDVAATVDGYPNPQINTLYDDYAAFRTETGLPGGAYWNDRNGDGLPGWVRVNDPRLFGAPRAIRVVLESRW